MTGSITELTLDDGIDLARIYNITLEAIALQTRHILKIYMSGGLAKNIVLVQLIANTCSISVILPRSPSAAVVLGAAMLGRFAAGVSTLGPQRKLSDDEQRRLWSIMVEMMEPGTLLKPSVTPREKRLPDAKYKIFRVH